MSKHEKYCSEHVFPPCSAFLWDFSLCQDRLSGDASELGTALLCNSRAGSVYVAVSRNSIVHLDWGRIIQYTKHCSFLLLPVKATISLSLRRTSHRIQWDSNPRPFDLEANALPYELPFFCLANPLNMNNYIRILRMYTY